MWQVAVARFSSTSFLHDTSLNAHEAQLCCTYSALLRRMRWKISRVLQRTLITYFYVLFIDFSRADELQVLFDAVNHNFYANGRPFIRSSMESIDWFFVKLMSTLVSWKSNLRNWVKNLACKKGEGEDPIYGANFSKYITSKHIHDDNC